MSSKLKVEELRAQLSARGLQTIGVKALLVQRLEEAIREEEEEKASKDVKSGSSVGTKKRLRESEDGESQNNLSIEKIREKSVKELRELATARGIPASGSKKELIQRLSTDIEKEGKVSPQAKQPVNEVEGSKEKLVTNTKKGRPPLDQWLPDHIKSNYHVMQDGEDFYDATLNQTNLGVNNNKFYIIQALESADGQTFMVYSRWGRVGVKGQEKLSGPYTTRDESVKEFQAKFFEKTKNRWHDRGAFKSYPKHYTWLEMDYDEVENEPVANKNDDSRVGYNPEEKISAQLRQTKLEARIAKFISLICSIDMMKQQMLEIGYNANKLPLGKLSRSTVMKGYDVLRRISDVIEQADRKSLEQLSGEFYTVIPHDFGFSKMRDFVIDTPSKLKAKLEMVAALGEIEIATKILKDDVNKTQDDPLHYPYKQLRCELTPVEIDSEEFTMVEKYMHNTHGRTHSNYSAEIVQLFKVSKHGEADRFKRFSNVKNRMLLWHGSRLTNWVGILSQGLRIAPPEAPVNGYMFGKGVYFADMFSKSANYCYASTTSISGVLLLCEVALGEMAELLAADYNANNLPEGKLSTKGLGSWLPNPSETLVLEDGVIIPLGKPIDRSGPKGALMYNEYIVYNVDQICMRYVLHVKFKFKK